MSATISKLITIISIVMVLNKTRFWKIDFARGLAVILMVLFNWSFTLKFLNVFALTDSWLYWRLFPRLIGGSFIFLAGISIILFYNKTNSLKKVASRGLKIFLIGIGITVITFLSFPSNTIYFGILHLIGLSLILSPFFLKNKNIVLLIASLILIIGFFLQSFYFAFSHLLWLGLGPENFQTFDYWPLMPWFGVFLFGMFFGDFLKNKKGVYTKNLLIKKTCFLGRNSLAVYLIHQPVLIGILYVFGFRIF